MVVKKAHVLPKWAMRPAKASGRIVEAPQALHRAEDKGPEPQTNCPHTNGHVQNRPHPSVRNDKMRDRSKLRAWSGL